MMGSLNEGVELDNEILDTNKEAGKALDKELFEEVVPGETPEISTELDILGMVTKRRDLDYAQINLETIGGINQEMAMEMHPLVPSLISDERPLGFYSKGVTKTQYSFAMEAIALEKESIGNQIKEAFVKFIEQIREKLTQLVNWFQKRMAEYLEMKVPAVNEVPPTKDLAEHYVRVFGQEEGAKLVEALRSHIEAHEAKMKAIRDRMKNDFYFISAYKKTPFFNKFMAFVGEFLKDLNKVVSASQDFESHVGGSNLMAKKDKLNEIAVAISGMVDFFRESAQTYPENNQGKHELSLSDSEVNSLDYEKVFEVHKNVVVSLGKTSHEIMELTKKLDDVLAKVAKSFDSRDNAFFDPLEKAFMQLLTNHSTACREVLKDTVRWTAHLGDAVYRFGAAQKDDIFKTRERQACEKLGLDASKLN